MAATGAAAANAPASASAKGPGAGTSSAAREEAAEGMRHAGVALDQLLAGCNRSPGSADWAERLAYGAGNAVVVCNPRPDGTCAKGAVLTGHAGRVNCVRWGHANLVPGSVGAACGQSGLQQNADAISPPLPAAHFCGLVSGGGDGVVLVWGPPGGGAVGTATAGAGRPAVGTPGAGPWAQWAVRAALKGHTEPVTCLDTAASPDGRAVVICSGAADGTVRVWATSEGGGAAAAAAAAAEAGGYALVQTLLYGSGFALAVALATLPGAPGCPVMAVGGDDCAVRLYASPRFGAPFELAVTLRGHDDWVRAVSFASFDDGTLVLASGAQDMYVRLWVVSAPGVGGGGDGGGAAAPVVATGQGAPAGNAAPPAAAVSEFRRRALRDFDLSFTCAGARFTARFDSLLMGHDGWVYSVRWHPRVGGSQPAALLSASMDRTLTLWVPDPVSGVWVDAARMGEAGGTYTNGLFGGLWSSNGSLVLAHGFHGAFFLWEREGAEGGGGVDGDGGDGDGGGGVGGVGAVGQRWTPRVAPTGHFGGVRDVNWDPTGACLVSASDDQTVRVYAECRRAAAPAAGAGGGASGDAGGDAATAGRAGEAGPGSSDKSLSLGWHEIARPQIHGYDMRCLCVVPFAAAAAKAAKAEVEAGPPTVPLFAIATGADEKVIRVFEPPTAFADALHALTGAARVFGNGVVAGAAAERRPVGASIPALGLSNKAVFHEDVEAQRAERQGERGSANGSGGGDGGVFSEGVVLPFEPVDLREPPLEGHLKQNTLWPEAHKLYGHGYELVSLAVSHDGSTALSSCRAAAAEHAVLRVWSTRTWREVGQLPGHKLTVTRAAFDPTDEWIASGSRDRQVCVYRRVAAAALGGGGGERGGAAASGGEGGGASAGYALHQVVAKAHDRIIWDVAWAPRGTVAAFATGSRDKTVKIWALSGGPERQWKMACRIGKLEDSVTAVDWARAMTHAGAQQSHVHVLAVGFDSGSLVLHATSSPGATVGWAPLLRFPAPVCHTATVTRVRWRPRPQPRGGDMGGGGSCGSGCGGASTLQLATCSADASVRLFSVRLA